MSVVFGASSTAEVVSVGCLISSFLYLVSSSVFTVDPAFSLLPHPLGLSSELNFRFVSNCFFLQNLRGFVLLLLTLVGLLQIF